jgi:hypothetical protein
MPERLPEAGNAPDHWRQGGSIAGKTYRLQGHDFQVGLIGPPPPHPAHHREYLAGFYFGGVIPCLS